MAEQCETVKAAPRYQVSWEPCGFCGSAKRIILEGEAREAFVSLYPTHCNRELSEWFGVSRSTVCALGRRMKLKKDLTFLGQRRIEEMTRKVGKDNLPLAVFRREHPEEYRRVCKENGRKKHLLAESERRRLALGFEQRTRMHIVVKRLSAQARTHKSDMIRQCNYFAVDGHPSWVCYDSETRRSPRREATAVKHELRIVAADE